jgi:hypothetical protein
LVLATLQALLNQLDDARLSGVTKTSLQIFSATVISFQWFVQISIPIFMFQSETQGAAVKRTVIITTLLLLPMFAANLVSLITHPLSMPYLGLFIVEIVQTLFFIVIILAYLTRRHSPRKAAAGWSAYQTVTHLLFTLSYGFQLKNQFSIIGRCFDVSTSGIYFLLYSFVLYTTIKHDSIYWKKKGAFLRATEFLDTDSPSEALQRFLESGVHIVQFKDIDIRREIGSGSYGDVHEAKYKGTIVAVKRLRMSYDDVDHVTLLVQEAALFSRLRHPNVVQFMALSTSPPAIISEFCSNGSLWDLMHPHSASAQPPVLLDWSRRIRIMKDVCRGMFYLHSCTPAIIHRDLKSANVLLDGMHTIENLQTIKLRFPYLISCGFLTFLSPNFFYCQKNSVEFSV